MRFLAILAIALLLAVPGASAEPWQAAKPPGKSAEKIVDAMIAALGGKAFLEVREIHNSGHYFPYFNGELNGSDVFTDYIRFPGEERLEVGSPKYRTITINSGDAGWTVQNKGVWEQSDEQTANFSASFLTSFEYVTRFVLNDSDATLQNIGAETLNLARVDVLEVRDADKNRIRFYIDVETNLPLKMQVRMAGDTQVREELYANWHRFDSVWTPLTLERYRDGVKVMETRVETVRYNAGLADNLFAP